jgi:hypothetical protein
MAQITFGVAAPDSFALFTAIRRASSLLSNVAAGRPPMAACRPRFSQERSLRHQIIHGQFIIVISLLPPSFEGTVNFSTLRWHGVGGGAAGTELTTGGGSIGGSPNASAG